MKRVVYEFFQYTWLTIGTDPTRVTVDIVSVKISNQGRSCEEYDVCGSVLKIDALVHFRTIHVNE